MTVSDKQETAQAQEAQTPEAMTEPPAGYEAGVQELEALVAKMESGQMPLDTLLSAYERGTQLLQFCQEKLAVLEQRVQVLDKDGLKAWGGEEQ